MAGRTGSGDPVAGMRWARSAVGNGAVGLSVALMSFGPSIVKKVEMAEMSFIFWRLALAAVLYASVLVATGSRVTWADLRKSALGGVAFGVNMVLFIVTMRRTSAVNAVVIASLQPVVLMAAGARLFGERPHRSVYGWGALAFGGVVVAVAASDAGGVATPEGDLLAVVMMLTYAAYMVISKQARTELDSSTYQLSLTLVALATVLPIAFVVEGGVAMPVADDWWLLVAMAVLPGSGHLLVNVAHGYTSLTMVSLVNLAFTAVAPLYAWWLVGEGVGGTQAAGMAVVMVALGFVVTRPVEVVGR